MPIARIAGCFLSLALAVIPGQATARTVAQTISLELALVEGVELKLDIDKDCPANNTDTEIVARQKMATLKIPVQSEEEALYAIKISVSCLAVSETVMAYAGDLELRVPVALPTDLTSGKAELASAAQMPVWAAKRFGSLGSPPRSLQTRALFLEVEGLVSEFGEMWTKSRAYRQKLEEMSRKPKASDR